ncbi:TPA: MipA/OmpV family protein [Yersinia enterocolitica]
MKKHYIKTKQVKTLAALAVATAVCMPTAMAGTWSLGASALVSPDPYRGKNDRVYPVPIVSYESDNFYFRTLAAGYYLWKDDNNRLSIDAYYLPLHFTPGDSDDQQMKQLDKRRSTLMAGMSYSHIEDWGTLRAMFSGDVLDNSGGFVGDLAYLYRFSVDSWTLTPGVGVAWNSEDQNKYYYGVSRGESARSGLAQYSPSDSWSPYLELTANYNINPNWNAFFTGRYIHLANEVKNSPMVDASWTGVLWTGITYTFR